MSNALMLEEVTPKKAEQWLNKNTNNRALRSGVVEKYTADMLAGKWTKCFDPIVFYADGTVADGQHRLWAVIESKTTQKFYVAHNAEAADGLNIDTGIGRSFVDNVKISTGTSLSTNVVAATKWIEYGTRKLNRGMSYSEQQKLVAKHLDAAVFGCSHTPHKRGLCRAPVSAALARAWYVETDKAKLERFAEVYTTGMANGPHESAAAALRNAALDMTIKGISSSDFDRELFLKAQNAIRYFMRGRKLTLLKNISEEAYPLKKARSK